MKVLTAAACVAIVLFVGYFFFGEYKEHRERAQRAERREEAREELFRLANAEPYEIDKVQSFCVLLRDRARKDDSANEMIEILVRNCRGLGYL